MKVRLGLFLCALCILQACVSGTKKNETLPDGFVYLSEVDASIIQEMRYADIHNFMGRPIPGYLASKCILTREAAEALKNVQSELRVFSLTLKVYDCFRPQRAVNAFISWAADLKDIKMKREFYPRLGKEHLFKDGYIAEKSGHSRGSTVDLTIVPLPVLPQEQFHKGDKLRTCDSPASIRFGDNSLDFGTGFDCLDPKAHTANPSLSLDQKKNRVMFKSVMEKYGFKNLDVEWWHFTLKNEPYPDHYFDFPVL
jgi:zinc D-Ala-D-Ala dipeptidase